MLINRLKYLFYRTTLFIISLIPFRIALYLADGLGAFLLKFNKRRMEMTRSNLKKAFGNQKSESEIENMVRRVNGRLFQIVVEFSKIPQLIRNTEQKKVCVDADIILNVLKRGRGAVLLVSHLGNWELAAIGGGFAGFQIHAIGKPHPNPFIDRHIQKIRGKTGLKSIEKYGSVQDVSRILKQNQVVCFPMDQRVKEGEPVPFLGQTAYLSTLPALLAIRYKTPVIPCFVYREAGPRYFVTSKQPLPIVEGKTLRESLHLSTARFAKRIEEEILKNPTDWVLWRHNIWKR